jgi:hypothetical protein
LPIQACEVADKLVETHPEVVVEKKCFTRDEYHEFRKTTLKKLNKSEDSHTTCPLVFTSLKNVPQAFVGGCDSFTNTVRTEFKGTVPL